MQLPERLKTRQGKAEFARFLADFAKDLLALARKEKDPLYIMTAHATMDDARRFAREAL